MVGGMSGGGGWSEWGDGWSEWRWWVEWVVGGVSGWWVE